MSKLETGAVQTSPNRDSNAAGDENPEWTAKTFERAKRFADLPGPLRDKLDRARGRGPQKALTKQQISIRLDQDAVAWFKAGGAGWQTRLNDALVAFVTEQKKRP